MNKLKKPNDTMKAIEIVKFGGPENLKLKLRNIPKLKKGEILIKVHYAGVNRPDILQREKVIIQSQKPQVTFQA